MSRRTVSIVAEQIPEILGRFLERKVDVIVAWSTPAAGAAKKATRTVPIVFIDQWDPVGTGVIKNVTEAIGSIDTGTLAAILDAAGITPGRFRELL